MELDSYLSDKQKKRKRRRRYISLVLVLAAIGLLFTGAAWLVFRSPILRIQKIVVQGNSAVPSGDILALLQGNVLRGHPFWPSLLGIGNMLAWPATLPASDLSYIPQLASLTLSKDYLSRTITADVTERQPFAIWCFTSGTTVNESCYWFDDQGVLFERTFDTEGSLMFAIHDNSQKGLGLNDAILPDGLAPNLISIIKVLTASGIQVNSIALNDLALQEIDITTYEGPALYFSLRFPADDDLSILESLMAKPNFTKLQYIDFRIENRAYYK